jgi:CRISPR-associated protein Cmr4
VNSAVLGLLAETSVHPGAGRSLGVVDLPVAREAASGYPVIVGSSLKGSLREAAEDRLGPEAAEDVNRVFGKPDNSGDVLVSDARLLLLPVRSLASASRWITCPHLIERYRRALARAGLEPGPQQPAVEQGTALAVGCEQLQLEERQFEVRGEPDPSIVDLFLPLVRHQETHRRLCDQLVVLSDHDFAWFTEFGLPVQARNNLEDGTKRSLNLWYEETLPPDTVMYAVLLSRKPERLAIVRRLFGSGGYLQVGGNATVGQGWFAVSMLGKDAR